MIPFRDTLTTSIIIIIREWVDFCEWLKPLHASALVKTHDLNAHIVQRAFLDVKQRIPRWIVRKFHLQEATRQENRRTCNHFGVVARAQINAQTVVDVPPRHLRQLFAAADDLDVVQDVFVRVLHDIVYAEPQVDQDLSLDHDQPVAPHAIRAAFQVQQLLLRDRFPALPTPVQRVKHREHVFDALGTLFHFRREKHARECDAERIKIAQRLAVIEAVQHRLRRDHHDLRKSQQDTGFLDQFAAEKAVVALRVGRDAILERRGVAEDGRWQQHVHGDDARSAQSATSFLHSDDGGCWWK